MRICEKVAAWIVAVTIPAELVAASAIDGGGEVGAWAWGMLIGAGVLQLTAIALVKLGARGTDNPSTACGGPTSLTSPQANVKHNGRLGRPYGHGLRSYEEVRK